MLILAVYVLVNMQHVDSLIYNIVTIDSEDEPGMHYKQNGI